MLTLFLSQFTCLEHIHIVQGLGNHPVIITSMFSFLSFSLSEIPNVLYIFLQKLHVESALFLFLPPICKEKTLTIAFCYKDLFSYTLLPKSLLSPYFTSNDIETDRLVLSNSTPKTFSCPIYFFSMASMRNKDLVLKQQHASLSGYRVISSCVTSRDTPAAVVIQVGVFCPSKCHPIRERRF